MKNKSINFKKERDFGDLFNDTFAFIGQEFKRFGTAILYYVVPLLILSAIFSTIYSVKLQGAMQSIIEQTSTSDPFLAFTAMGSIAVYVLLTLILSIIAVNMMLCIVYSYIKMYVKFGREGFTINDVWREALKNFWHFILTSIIVGLIVMVGLGLCIIPGVYLSVALSLVFAIMMFEDQGLSSAFNRSFKLIKSKWWFTFGVFIVTGIIVYILSLLLSIPSIAMGFKSLFFNLKQAHSPAMNFSVGFYIISSVTNLITQFFIVIPIIITSFLYFSFVEEKEKPSILEKIDQINDNE